jgi:sulfite reductase alpha subunit-like flavoprotein
MLAFVFIGLAVIFLTAYFVTRKRVTPSEPVPESKEQNTKTEKINYGPLHIFYGSQTGTAAKLSEQLAEEAND